MTICRRQARSLGPGRLLGCRRRMLIEAYTIMVDRPCTILCSIPLGFFGWIYNRTKHNNVSDGDNWEEMLLLRLQDDTLSVSPMDGSLNHSFNRRDSSVGGMIVSAPLKRIAIPRAVPRPHHLKAN